MDSSISKGTRLKIDEAGIDRISVMPDSILRKILSYLPTKNAVATNILSKRWKHIFFGVSPIKLTFDDRDFFARFSYSERENLLPHFRDFVDKVLQYETSLDVPRVESMSLSCENSHGIDKITSWVSTALQFGVQTLVLELALDGSRAFFGIFNGCATLVSLSLRLTRMGERILHVPDNFSIPNLKKLRLFGVEFDDSDGDYINKCLKGCPVLEDLSFINCEFHVSEVIFIRSKLLKFLTIDSSEYAGFSLDLDAPNLEGLIFRCSATRRHRIFDFKSLRTAHIDTRRSTHTEDKLLDMGIMYDEDADQYVNEGILELVSACSNTIRLHLARRSIYALHGRSVRGRLPEFQNLTSLRLGSMAPHGWALLAQLLHNSPNLKELSFEQEFKEKKIAEGKRGYADFEHLVMRPPMCLQSHVKQIVFCIFNWTEEESKLLTYFLKNGKVLEKVILRCLPSVINVLTMFSMDPKIVLEPR